MNDKYLLVFAVVLLIVLNYNFIDGLLEETFSRYEEVEIERVIDGDTVVVNGTSVRLLGINTPERGEKYYVEAKEYLEDLVMNKTLKIKIEGQDRYYRELGYLFYENKNLNLEMVKRGFANYYFPSGKDKYYEDFVKAWEECLENLCEKSENICVSCLELELDVSNDKIKIENRCSFSCELTEWSVKDEGRKKFVFGKKIINVGEKVILGGEDFNKSYVLTESGDSVFLRDSEGKLVLFENF